MCQYTVHLFPESSLYRSIFQIKERISYVCIYAYTWNISISECDECMSNMIISVEMWVHWASCVMLLCGIDKKQAQTHAEQHRVIGNEYQKVTCTTGWCIEFNRITHGRGVRMRQEHDIWSPRDLRSMPCQFAAFAFRTRGSATTHTKAPNISSKFLQEMNMKTCQSLQEMNMKTCHILQEMNMKTWRCTAQHHKPLPPKPCIRRSSRKSAIEIFPTPFSYVMPVMSCRMSCLM